MKQFSFLLLAFAAAVSLSARNFIHFTTPRTYQYRITFNDKKGTPFSIKQPEQFLSQKSIDRRKRMGLKCDEHDLPITPQYLKAVGHLGRIVTKSKWNNSAVVETSDTAALLQQVRTLAFAKNICRVWTRRDSMPEPDTTNRRSWISNKPDTLPNYYGAGYRQISQLNGQRLHEAGLRGKGVTIAIIDGGFCNADLVAGLQKADIRGTYDFVRPWRSVYEGQKHGMNVLSTIAAQTPYSFVGTAPDASFYLLVSEDDSTEHKVEEDYWCEAVEYADSVGCDVITSSLGYTEFDDTAEDFKYKDLNGRTEINSREASLAASRGILLLNSAGNSGKGRWKKIGVPADATDMLSVGAVDSTGYNTDFSSIGMTADNRIKPDVMAMGEKSAIFDTSGLVASANGTSFSTPILCGMAACLCQAFPNERPQTIIRAIQQSANNYATPDNIFGYGIPNMWKAYELLQQWKH